jgi:two-component system, chemotaxis family, chemotaxis protein CheY
LRILLVDDDISSVDALRELLQFAGHQVAWAENGQAALELLRDGSDWCAILLDIMMPEMDGYEFRRRQLDDPEIAGIPVIVVTADGRAKEKAKLLKTERCFQKPLPPEALLKEVRNLCPITGGVPN